MAGFATSEYLTGQEINRAASEHERFDTHRGGEKR
jgi:hypothetical protein